MMCLLSKAYNPYNFNVGYRFTGVTVRVRAMTLAFVLNAFLYATRRRGSTRKSG